MHVTSTFGLSSYHQFSDFLEEVQIGKIRDVKNRGLFALFERELSKSISSQIGISWLDYIDQITGTRCSNLPEQKRVLLVCFLFAVAIDDGMVDAEKIDAFDEKLQSIDDSFLFYLASEVPTIVSVVILRYCNKDLMEKLCRVLLECRSEACYERCLVGWLHEISKNQWHHVEKQWLLDTIFGVLPEDIGNEVLCNFMLGSTQELQEQLHGICSPALAAKIDELKENPSLLQRRAIERLKKSFFEMNVSYNDREDLLRCIREDLKGSEKSLAWMAALFEQLPIMTWPLIFLHFEYQVYQEMYGDSSGSEDITFGDDPAPPSWVADLEQWLTLTTYTLLQIADNPLLENYGDKKLWAMRCLCQVADSTNTLTLVVEKFIEICSPQEFFSIMNQLENVSPYDSRTKFKKVLPKALKAIDVDYATGLFYKCVDEVTYPKGGNFREGGYYREFKQFLTICNVFSDAGFDVLSMLKKSHNNGVRLASNIRLFFRSEAYLLVRYECASPIDLTLLHYFNEQLFYLFHFRLVATFISEDKFPCEKIVSLLISFDKAGYKDNFVTQLIAQDEKYLQGIREFFQDRLVDSLTTHDAEHLIPLICRLVPDWKEHLVSYVVEAIQKEKELRMKFGCRLDYSFLNKLFKPLYKINKLDELIEFLKHDASEDLLKDIGNAHDEFIRIIEQHDE